MNKKGEINIFEIILLVVVIGLIFAYVLGWISFGKQIVPSQEELPQISENQTETGEVVKFQKCTIASDCNWDYTKYYNRNCTGAWRCLESPTQGEYLCDYGCNGNEYCGDSVCGGVESSWSCIDCSPTVGFIGKLIIS